MNLESLKQFASDRQIEFIDAVLNHGTQRQAADFLGVNQRTLERSLQKVKANASKQGWSPDHDMTHIAPSTHVVKGVSTFYDENGKPIRQWVKTDLKKENAEAALLAFADGLTSEITKYVPIPVSNNEVKAEQLTAIIIGDAHIGMLVTNNSDQGEWNIEIAERVTTQAIQKLIKASGPSEVGLLLNVGDFLHANNAAGTTAKGTPLDVDGHFSDALMAAVRVYRNAVDMMLEVHNKVVLMNTRGNHDSDVAMVVNIMLQTFYSDEPRVTVLDNVSKFMSYIYGNVMITSHHGDRMKPQSAFEYFTRTMAKEWGETKHRYCIMGHIHHKQATEIGGSMTFEAFNTLAPPDNWHSDSGYGSSRSMSAVVYCKEWGEVQRHRVSMSKTELG
jgi:hypothetical protein